MPDGRIIFKTSNYWGDNTQAGLYISGGGGSIPDWITSSGQDAAPAVHGGTVAFMSIRQPDDYEIFTSNIYGLDANLKQLTHNDAQDGLPTWSPDGRHIAFVSDEGGAWGLWVIKADGSGRYKLLDLPGTLGGDWGTERISWAP
jgi:TolB protein